MAHSTESPTFHIVWVADNIEEVKRSHPQSFTHLQNIVRSFDTFGDADLFMNFLFENSDKKIFMIVTGALGKETMPIIHDASQLDSVFVFCHNKAYHEQWAKEWPKVKGVFNQMDVMCKAVEQAVQQPELIQPKPAIVLPKSPPVVRRSITPEPPHRTHLVAPVPAEPTTIERETARPRDSSSSPLINSRSNKRTTTEIPNSRLQLPAAVDEDEHTLIAKTEKEVRKSSQLNNNHRPSTLVNMRSIDEFQNTIVQTIEKHVTKKKGDDNALDRLYADIKQLVADAVVNMTSELTNHRKPITIATNREVKITVDLKQTRIDAAFRQQRDAVVAKKRLRDAVQQWSSIGSMIDLVTTIKTHGKNNLECAWLLFCWIGQNIQYQPFCTSNSAETVFRTRKGVCRGFVSLYHECCSLLNIECSEISGYAKQAFLKPGEELKQSPHAWNSIVLDQYTYLIDPTWGAGGRDNENKLEDFYFLTSPEEFIYTHYCAGYQLLKPEITKEEFLSLPIMKTPYYQLGLTLLSPKQGLNEGNENLFKIAIRTPEHVNLFVQLKVDNTEYPRNLHTLCQRDETQSDVYNCYITPPLNGLYEVAIYAKKKDETHYQDAINMRLRVLNIVDAFTFPLIYSIFTEHHCILIEPLQRLVYKNEEVLIHMIVPHANVIKVQNGDDYMVPCKDEYKRGVLRKTVRVQGDLHICARWDDNADSIAVICIFNMI